MLFISLAISLGPAYSGKLLNSSSSCAGISNYPISHSSYFRLTGGVIGGKPVLCGGETNGTESSACYAYNKTSDLWTLLANMVVPRRGPAGAVVNGALWVTGGYKAGQGINSYLKTTEFIFPNGTTSDGPDLPEARWRHCMVTLHDTRVMIIGTEGLMDGKSVEIFDPDTNTFSKGPDMMFKRGQFGAHFCLC